MALQDFGPYRIVRKIAVGGMAEIYLARQRGIEGLERTVVIKQIVPRYAQDEEFVTMFLDEARLMAALSHPNIAQVFDLGRAEGSYYLVVEHVRGPTLGRLLGAARERPARTLPVREALGIALSIAEALHYVHGRKDELGRPLGIVHRDLNPSNVMVSYDGAVKLIDFGIAKAASRVYETRAGVIKGTYGYSAPEQLTGGQVDRRADVFALGILLYEMIAGEHPYDVSDEPNLIDRIALARYRRAREVRPDIPDDLDRLITSCLSPTPDGRPGDMQTLLGALSEHLGKRGLVPTQASLGQVTRELVPPDDEGAPVVRRPTAVSLPAPIVTDPGGTRRLRIKAAAPITAPKHIGHGEHAGETWSEDEGTVRLSSEESTLPELMSVADVEDVPTVALVGSGPKSISSLPKAPARRRRQTPTDLVPPRRSRPKPALPFVIGLAAAGALTLATTFAVVVWAVSSGDAVEPAPVVAPAPVATPAAARISVISEPAGATVLVDGRRVEGVTPLSITLPAGARQAWVHLSLAGHDDQERLVSAGAGEARFVLVRRR
ncbi:MAG: serine/threonine protein kinase [Sandaracinaceae bacterium]|nr:serine/threonine protein kinase [Sandaracinaceae bacterium]